MDGSELQDEEGNRRSNYAEAAKVLSVVQNLLEVERLGDQRYWSNNSIQWSGESIIRLFQQAGGRDMGEPYHGLKKER